MNNLTNYHSHCDFCDGHAPMELFVREADERRVFLIQDISSLLLPCTEWL